MPIDTELEKLIINKGLTKEQFEQAFAEGSIGDNDFSFVDDIIDGMQNKITNCITEIPQDIKLELVDGVLTLKAGSKVYVPNGFESDGTTLKFDELVIENDRTFSYNSTLNNLVIVANALVEMTYLAPIRNVTSGTTEPSLMYEGRLWYDTTNNMVKYYHSGTTGYSRSSFPIAIVNCIDTNKFIINQTFNGFGYIGSTVFALPGVKGLIPNGRNEDGSLKNVEYTTSNISTINLSGSVPTIISVNQNGTLSSSLYYTEQEEQPTGGQTLWYEPSGNIMSRINANGALVKPFDAIVIATNDCTNGKISNFKPKTTFRAVDWNDISEADYVVETYQNGTDWYRLYKSGWVEQGGQIQTANKVASTLTFLKPMVDTNYTFFITQKDGSEGDYSNGFNTKKYTTTSLVIMNRTGGSCATNWVLCGKGA